MRVLAVAPHPDDETLGCGGTLVDHVRNGDTVEVVFLTSGERGGHEGRSTEEVGNQREAEAKRAATVLGVQGIEFWHGRDGGLTANQRLVARLRECFAERKVDRVYVPHDREMHPDHRAASRAVQQAARVADRHRPEVLLTEIWTPLQAMTHIVDITDHLDRKLDAIRCYESQASVVGFEQAMTGLARYRGELHSWPGGPYAEIFLETR